MMETKRKYATLVRIVLMATLVLGGAIALAIGIWLFANAGFDRHMMGCRNAQANAKYENSSTMKV